MCSDMDMLHLVTTPGRRWAGYMDIPADLSAEVHESDVDVIILWDKHICMGCFESGVVHVFTRHQALPLQKLRLK